MNLGKRSFHMILSALALTLLSAGAAYAIGVADLPKAELPVMVTSIGQAPDGNVISVLARRAGAEVTYETLAPAADVKNYKTVFISLGVSLKGFGAAGVNLDTELARGAEIFQTVKDNGVFPVCTHTGGSGRRDQMSNKIIETFAGQCAVLIVWQDGNKDDIFTNIAQQNNVPMLILEKPVELTPALQQMLK